MIERRVALLATATWTAWTPPDLRSQRVTMTINGARGEGQVAARLGDPLKVLAWLAHHLSAAGRSLRVGEFVSTGTPRVSTQFIQAITYARISASWDGCRSLSNEACLIAAATVVGYGRRTGGLSTRECASGGSKTHEARRFNQ